MFHNELGNGEYIVRCERSVTCGLRSSAWLTKEDATFAWNRRAAPAAPSAHPVGYLCFNDNWNLAPSLKRKLHPIADAEFVLACDLDSDHTYTRVTPLYDGPVAAQPIPEWISVKDRLPDDGALVVIFDPESDQEVWPAKWGAENNSFDSNGGWFEQDEVTHWMLLPPAPADKGEG
jgi:hypothetical protein